MSIKYHDVNVGVTLGVGGSNAESWNLASESPLIGTVYGAVATAQSGVTYDTSGAIFDAAADYISFPCFNFFNLPVVIEVEVARMQLTSLSTHQRFIMAGAAGRGLIYRSTHIWGLYNGSWTMSSFTDGNLFDNSVVRVEIDEDGKWHIYKNGTLLWEPNAVLKQTTTFRIGETDGQSILNSTISKVSFSWGSAA